MTTLQLIRHVHASGKHEVDTVVNREKKPPMSFKKNGEKPYLLGSERLLELAYALRDSYRISAIAISDSLGNRLDEEESALLTAEVRKAVNSSNRSAFNAIVDQQMRDLYVVYVELQDKKNPRGGMITVYRQGAVEVHSQAQLDLIGPRLVAALGK